MTSVFTNKLHYLLSGEISNHEPRVNNVVENGQKLISDGHPNADEFNRQLDELVEKWQALKAWLPLCPL